MTFPGANQLTLLQELLFKQPFALLRALEVRCPAQEKHNVKNLKFYARFTCTSQIIETQRIRSTIL